MTLAGRRLRTTPALRRVARAGLAGLGLGLALAGAALAAPAADAVAPGASAAVAPQPPGFRDPGLPPALRPDAPAEARARALEAMRAAPRASGPALAAQVQRHLREAFDAADVTHRGALTREEARAGGFGYVDRHFDAIDTRHAGEVTFEDLQAYLARRAVAH